MPYVTAEAIEAARQIDLLTYLRTQKPGELVHVSGIPSAPGSTTA